MENLFFPKATDISVVTSLDCVAATDRMCMMLMSCGCDKRALSIGLAVF